MENEAKPSENFTFKNNENADDHILSLWNEELQRSHQILRKVLEALPRERQGELVGLLKIIAEDSTSQKSESSLKSVAEQIVALACRDDKSSCDSTRHEAERRTGDRRRSDRRQG